MDGSALPQDINLGQDKPASSQERQKKAPPEGDDLIQTRTGLQKPKNSANWTGISSITFLRSPQAANPCPEACAEHPGALPGWFFPAFQRNSEEEARESPAHLRHSGRMLPREGHGWARGE